MCAGRVSAMGVAIQRRARQLVLRADVTRSASGGGMGARGGRGDLPAHVAHEIHHFVVDLHQKRHRQHLHARVCVMGRQIAGNLTLSRSCKGQANY